MWPQSLSNEWNLLQQHFVKRGGQSRECVWSLSDGVDVSHCEENKAAERKSLWFITAQLTHHAGSQGKQSPLSHSVFQQPV